MLQNNEKIEHEGVISEVSPIRISVRIKQMSACADCHAKGMCSISDTKEKIIEVPNLSNEYKIGDVVLITGDSSMGLMAVLYAFVIPLILIISVLMFAIRFFGSESLAVLLVSVSLVIYYVLLYFFREKLKNKFVFSLTKKL